MCIMCGYASCNAHAGALDTGDGSAEATSGENFVLSTGRFRDNPQDHFLKWGTDELGRESDEITWSLSLLGLDFDMSEYAIEQFEQAAQAAFDAWATVANLSFRKVEGDADIDVVTADANSQPALSGSTVGLASFSFSTGDDRNNDVAEIVSADIFMDLDVRWSPFGGSETNPNDSSGDLSYFGVVLHEIGHALGLGHVSDPNQIMNATIRTNQLGDGDIAGIRTLYGGREVGSDSADTFDLSAESGGRTVLALGGDDIVSGSQGNDRVVGGTGNDTLNGNGGNDFIIDTFGTNTLNGGAADDTLIGGIGQTTADGGSGRDTLIGGIRDDVLDGGSGDDILRGDPGNSFLFGNDRLIAGTGDDVLAGGGGADTFVFVRNGGTNTIGTFEISNQGTALITASDFQVGIDQVDLSDFGYTSFAEVAGNLRNPGSSTIFNDQNTSITFVGVSLDQLTSEDFLL